MHRIVAVLLLFAVLQGQAFAQSSAAPGPQQIGLRPGDLIRIEVWREKDLGGEFLVDTDGVVVLPLIGQKQVVGVPVRELRDQLIEQYRVHLQNPSITVTPLRRVNVLGEVGKPGLYAIDPTISLAGAVAMAGGATYMGDLARIRIIREGQVLHRRVGPGETLTTADVQSGDQIIVDRRGWLERNTNLVVSSVISVTSIMISLLALYQN